MNVIRTVTIILLLLISTPFPLAATELPPQEILRQWIAEMKIAPRGPFSQIRWFCNDGSILPPKAYACRDHGGGVQHGEWTDRVNRLRAGGYYVANILAALDLSLITDAQGYSDL